jgi:ADP-ribosyl-[dinitrogen reductase] hydrolase
MTPSAIEFIPTTPPRSADAVHIQRAVGALVGSACADALGAPFEFGPPGAYRQRFPAAVLGGTGELIGGGGFGWAPGEFTDDTQMALCLAESLAERRGLDPDDVRRRWQRWARSARDVGITTRHALAHVTDGARRAHEATGGRSAANGALMRVTPVALAYLDDEASCLSAALAQAAITHFDPAAGWGAALAALTVRRLVLGESVDAAVDAAVAHLPADQLAVFAPLLDDAWDPERAPEGMTNGSVWVCLAQAVWAVRRHDSFHDAVVAVVDLGGDTDTVACVAGALAGAAHSIEGVPSRWSTYVHGTVSTEEGDRRYTNADLAVLARHLIGKTPPVPTAWDHEPTEPVKIAAGLYAADLAGASRAPRDWAVVSLSFTRGLFAEHPVRREVYILDEEDPANANLAAAARDAVDTVEALLAEGRTVVVHCHGGRSRTGMVLKGWVMRAHGLDERAAHAWVLERYGRCADWNASFRRLLEVGL